MDFDSKPIGIGNLTNLKKKLRSAQKIEPVQLKKVPAENSVKQSSGDDEDVAQLAVDVYETNDELFIVAPLAGLSPDDVRIEITEDIVVIEGERENPLPNLEADDLLVQECYFGSFSRSIVLPEAIDSKKAKAQFQKNVLILSMPKLDNVRTRVVKVKAVGS